MFVLVLFNYSVSLHAQNTHSNLLCHAEAWEENCASKYSITYVRKFNRPS